MGNKVLYSDRQPACAAQQGEGGKRLSFHSEASLYTFHVYKTKILKPIELYSLKYASESA